MKAEPNETRGSKSRSSAARARGGRAAVEPRGVFDPAQAETLSDALRALANPTRLRLVAFLAEKGERTVGDLARSLALTQAATSQALAALRNGGLVKVRRDGGFRYYDLAVPDVVVLIQCLAGCCRNHGRSPAAEE